MSDKIAVFYTTFTNATEILNDYRLAWRSRFLSIIGRKEVLTGKASFGIFGDGIELAQIAMAKNFRKGDFRAGYYRDQTIELASDQRTVAQCFSQLYADINIDNEPNSGGRQMNNHFASRLLDEHSAFKNLLNTKNTAADLSPTAGQMAKLIGLAYASKLYRQNPQLSNENNFSFNGNELVFGSIGDASTSEGLFFEAMNAAAVLQIPLLMSVWDNGYGISVPTSLQTVNKSISQALAGFCSEQKGQGLDIYRVEAWNYEKLVEIYAKASKKVRQEHKPAIIHVIEVTQPSGHSTSDSHERYKPAERLQWEREYCCLAKLRQWILKKKLASQQQLLQIEQEEQNYVEQERKKAWELLSAPILLEKQHAIDILQQVSLQFDSQNKITEIIAELKIPHNAYRRNIQTALFKGILFLSKHFALKSTDIPIEIRHLIEYYQDFNSKYKQIYRTKLYSDSKDTPLNIQLIPVQYAHDAQLVDGRIILLHCFDYHLANNNKVFIIGEDVGKLGDVNLVFEGLYAKYGELRISDTGIRESTILGQGIGAALRGLRPIVDIQYLDYFLYCLQTAADDLASLFYRTAGGQKAPVIIRTKGHRLEGIWHSGSPMGMILNAIRGIYICVPRNMTQTAGMYNVLLRSDNPALVIEVLNGYRLKEKIPTNIGEFTIPLGIPEILHSGEHLSLVTYGACCKIALEAAIELANHNIYIEIIDIQTLIPFDLTKVILQSIKKTNAVLFLDEDVPGGSSAYMLQQVLERDDAFHFLDIKPRTLSAAENRSAYGRDGDFYSKPQVEDIIKICISMMHERDPVNYSGIYLCSQ